MRAALTAIALLSASPAFAAGEVFFSLRNTDFVVTIAFLLFVGVLVYLKVPPLLNKMLDRRAETIRSELEEAKALREEAQSLLASYERKHKDVQDQADRIVAHAKEEAAAAAEVAKADIALSVERRLAAAEDQIASAKSAAMKEVRDQAITVAVGAARDVLAKQMTDERQASLIDDAIDQVGAKLH